MRDLQITSVTPQTLYGTQNTDTENGTEETEEREDRI